ncbi:diacylglycerol kinase family protein [Pelagicoccus sp. NFK12]|uniref:Diacylglycerol kinase family protein n=1 Tax=Pelagicoccus enzymogenes TaxID=2773457 RepID=A0A927F7S1_9BACT|nr:diacylglycerol kinase family protein [Pelagicoccus enzymogenes]MBD5779515.1 diacylglycerol kinase family protein [Pelagicoccus enzymogenes]MDQ8200306.1 diacylglycerol kinase family protein [Pelagicoccus enzymogenes]
MKKRIQSFAHAIRGIRDFIACGTNAKIQLACAALVGGLGLALEFTGSEWIAVTLCAGFVLSAEALNTAIEELANEVSPERKESIRRVKDIAAGAVLIAAVTSLLVAATLLYSRI